jgi:DNA-binding winged helix-turn-helix (wHTH) protein
MFYEFGGLRYYPQGLLLTAPDGKRKRRLTPQHHDFLLALLTRAGKTISYAELWAEVWPDEARAIDDPDARHKVTVAKGSLAKRLHEAGGPASLIEAVQGQGYRLNAAVKERYEGEPPPKKSAKSPVKAVALTVEAEPNEPLTHAPAAAPVAFGLAWVKEEKAYLLTASGLYAALFVVALFLEIAYAFGSYGPSAARLAPFVWLWVGGAMFLSLGLAALVKRHNGLLLAVLWLALAQAALVGALSFFLPAFPATESHLQAQTAFGAYFKNAFLYFLPLGVFLLLLPWHGVAALRRELAAGRGGEVRRWLDSAPSAVAPAGAVYLKPKWLAVALAIPALPALALTQNLLGNLRPGPYQNLFTTLVWLRLLGYFALGVAGVIWYEAAWRKCKKLAAAPVQNPANQENHTFWLRPRWAAGIAVWLLACGGGLLWGLKNAVATPHIDRVTVLRPAVQGREFGVRIEGAAFDPQTVRLGVVGPSCREEPCFVPNSALHKYGAVSDKVIENAPLTLAEGEFGIFLQHSNTARSNTVRLAVPTSSGLLQSSLK